VEKITKFKVIAYNQSEIREMIVELL